MNSTQIKPYAKTFLGLLLAVVFTGELSFAKMTAEMLAPPAPKQAFPVSETIGFYTNKERTQKLSEDESNILKLSSLAQDVFEIKDFSILAHLTTTKEKVAAITTSQIANVIQQAIEKKSNWDESVSSSNLEKIRENAELLKKTLNESSYSWAWVNYQMGQKEDAKNFLIAKFENSYATVMKMKEVYNHRASPLAEAERLLKALKPMLTEDENKTREAQLKKMRMHVSTLPDITIMT